MPPSSDSCRAYRERARRPSASATRGPAAVPPATGAAAGSTSRCHRRTTSPFVQSRAPAPRHSREDTRAARRRRRRGLQSRRLLRHGLERTRPRRRVRSRDLLQALSGQASRPARRLRAVGVHRVGAHRGPASSFRQPTGEDARRARHPRGGATSGHRACRPPGAKARRVDRRASPPLAAPAGERTGARRHGRCRAGLLRGTAPPSASHAARNARPSTSQTRRTRGGRASALHLRADVRRDRRRRGDCAGPPTP